MCSKLRLRLDEFAFRQFDDSTYMGTKIPVGKTQFMQQLHQILKGDLSVKFLDGYASFCKHIIVRNWIPGIKVGAIPITPENQHLLKSGYFSRVEKELPVLCRWFSRDSLTEIPEGTFLDIILYSKEQITKECKAMGNPIPQEDFDYGVVSIKSQLEDFELPMSPITIMRNSLGKEEGGSGVPLDRTEYLKAVEYWDKHAMAR